MRILYPLLAALLLAACVGTSPQGPSEPALQPIAGSLQETYRREGTDFSQWRQLHVAPVDVHYDTSPRQDPRHTREEDFQLQARDLERVRDILAQAVAAAWEAAPGWELVPAPGPGVLTLQVTLEDFRLYAPIRDRHAGSSVTLTRESSRFVLAARLTSPDGEVLLESRDRRITGERGSGPLTLRQFSGVVYWQQLHQNLRHWATQLRPALQSS